MKNKYLIYILGAFCFGCKQDLINPNSASDQQVLSTKSGITALSIGLRQSYSTSVLGNTMLSPCVTAREMKGVATYFNVIELEQGGTNISVSNGNILSYWSSLQAEMGMCENIIANAPNVPGFDAATLSGIMAQAYLFKAMSLADLAMAFEQANLNTNPSVPVTFVSRDEVLKEALRLLDLAVAQIQANAPSTTFTTTISGADFDLVNTVYAMEARINLIAGNYQKALDNANLVDLAKTSRFVYSSLTPNPLYTIFIM